MHSDKSDKYGSCAANTGRSSGGGGSLKQLIEKAKTANDRQVLNAVPDSDLGKTFQTLSYSDKSTIKGALRLTKGDIDYLKEYGNRGNLSSSFRIGSTKYTTEISVDNGKVVYSLKRGRKKLVDNGTYSNVVNQFALLVRQAK